MNTSTNLPAVPVAGEHRISQYFHSELVQRNFDNLLGSKAPHYIMGVLLAVSQNKALQECSPESIYVSAIRAATMGMSVDPAARQGYLVPFKGKCTLIVGYKGLYDMAVRTNKYRIIHVGPIYEGEKVKSNRVTGAVWLDATNPDSKRTGDKIGWLAYFEMLNGMKHYEYMTVDEINEHAKKFSRSFDSKDGAWKTNPEEMQRKTVLRRLLTRWGYLDPADIRVLEDESEPGPNGEIFDAPAFEDTIEEQPPVMPRKPGLIEKAVQQLKPHRTAEEARAELGYDTPDPSELKGPVAPHDEGQYYDAAMQIMTHATAKYLLDQYNGDAVAAWDHILRTATPVAGK